MEKKAYNAAHYQNNIERYTQNHAVYREKNPEKFRVAGARFYKSHPEKMRQKNATYHQAHSSKIVLRHAIHRKARPEQYGQYGKTRRARKRGAPIHDFTGAQWLAMKAHYGYRCIYCGKKTVALTQDHITPLSKGGSHTLMNIVPACRRCNSRKQAGNPLIPVQPLLLVAAG